MNSQLSLVLGSLQEVARKLSLSSIVSFAPKLGKVLVCILFILNIKSWPFVWHFRVFRPVFQTQFRHKWVRFRGLFLSPAARVKLEDEWLDSISPLGYNPLTAIVPYKTWASIDDSDFNGHLSNSSYAKILDGARFKAAIAMFPMFLRAGGWIPLAGTNFSFVREIPILASYEIRTSIAAWDQKWIYVMSRFVRKPNGKKKQKQVVDAKASLSSGNGEPHMQTMSLRTPGSELISASGTPFGNETPSVPNSQPTPDSNTSLNLNAVAASLAGEEPDGAILHTVVISQCCFKIGRITVPPSVVLGVNGFTGASGFSHSSPHPEWETAKNIMSLPNGGSRRKLRKFLENGWREVPEGERWWEQALGGEIEEKRVKNLALIEIVKNGMENARNL